MGRAARWLRNLLGGSKKEITEKDSRSYSGLGGADEKREKKRWSFTRSARDSGETASSQNAAATAAAVEAAWFRSFYADGENEQSKHAIAVAAATAAAADAAVAAAQAAAAVVRLTSQGRGSSVFGGGAYERKTAAVRIQTAFRGYLSRKALRALKALVKLQALVRGYLVRKQAAATFQSMKALIRAQANVRAHRARYLFAGDRRVLPELRPRRSLERFDDSRSEHLSSVQSRRLSENGSSGLDRSPKIVEMDTCRPKSRSSLRTNSSLVLDSPEDLPMSSPLPYQIPARISIPDCRNFQDYDCCITGDKCRFSATAQSTPRYLNSFGISPATPAKSACGADGAYRRFLNLSNCPSYMANTQSFEAKVRSQSAPKQRPEPAAPGERMRKRLPLSEVMVESRASLSGFGMQKSCTKIQEAFNFKSAVVSKLDRPSSDNAREEEERDVYLHSKW